MKYSFELYNIIDNLIHGIYKSYNFDSDIINWRNNKDLINEIINKHSDKFAKSDTLAVYRIYPSKDALRNDYGTKIPEQYKELYEQSKKEWEEFDNSLEGKQFYCKEWFEYEIKHIKDIQNKAKEYNLLDSQEYLNFQDELNKLSLDENRPDSN